MRYQVVSGRQLVEELAGPRAPFVVDVRSRAEFEGGRVPGSHHFPVHEMGRQRDRLPSGLARRMVVVGNPGKRTHAGATWLALIGYGDVAILEGGVEAWPGELRTGPEKVAQRGPELRIIPDTPASEGGAAAPDEPADGRAAGKRGPSGAAAPSDSGSDAP